MPRAPKYSSGKYAWGMCDTCGIRCKLLELIPQFIRGQRTGMLACPTCDDPDHPQNFLDKYVSVDPQALRNPRPDTGLLASRRMFPTGIWLRGQRPDLPTQEMLIADQVMKDSNQVIEDAWENRRFWRANQAGQRGEKP